MNSIMTPEEKAKELWMLLFQKQNEKRNDFRPVPRWTTDKKSNGN